MTNSNLNIITDSSDSTKSSPLSISKKTYELNIQNDNVKLPNVRIPDSVSFKII